MLYYAMLCHDYVMMCYDSCYTMICHAHHVNKNLFKTEMLLCQIKNEYTICISYDLKLGDFMHFCIIMCIEILSRYDEYEHVHYDIYVRCDIT